MADVNINENEQVNPLELPDEEFLKLPIGGVPDEPEAPIEPEPSTDFSVEGEVVPGAESEVKENEPKESSGQEGKDPVDKAAGEKGGEGDPAPSPTEGEQKGEKDKTPEGTVPPAGSKPEGQDKPKAEGDGESAPTEPLNYAAIGEMVMKPFKANGKIFTPKTPDEVIKLAQMGAHFTQKMQAIQPHRKVLTMLENNQLLDEDRLSFLIDLEKKNPEAIKKFLKDAGVDPLDIDTTSEPAYQGGSHKVSDAEVAFRSALDDLMSTPEGKENLQYFNDSWDDASKDVVWGNPSLLSHLHAQKQSGVYDAISSEIERRRMLGSIGPETPFVKAYETVGAELHSSGALDPIILKASPSASGQVQIPVAPAPAAPAPVATKAAAPKQGADNNDKVSAAAPTRTGARPAKPLVNPLAMSDEEFLAQMKGRV